MADRANSGSLSTGERIARLEDEVDSVREQHLCHVGTCRNERGRLWQKVSDMEVRMEGLHGKIRENAMILTGVLVVLIPLLTYLLQKYL